MNNLSYSSYQKALNVVHAVVSATDAPETVVRTLPEVFAAGNDSRNSTDAPVKNSKAEQGEDGLLSNYQPVAHTSILPVHRLLF